MTEQVPHASDLEWWPHPVVAQAVRVRWPVNVPYTVYWGDGASQQVSGSMIVAHTYVETGTYDVVCVADASREHTTAARITVRGWTAPPEPAVTAHGREVTLTLPDVLAPVRWSISWGDGETSEHTEGTAVHSYPEPGEYTVTLLDVPSQRARRLPVQVMPPLRTWQDCGVWTYRRGSSKDYISGTFYGREAPASSRFWLRHTWSSTPTTFYGQASSDMQGWASGNVDYRNSWHKPTAEEHSGYDFAYVIPEGEGAEGYPPEVTAHSPVPMVVLDRAIPSSTPTVVWWFDLNDPWTVHAAIQSPREGTYVFDFGDGSEPVTVKTLATLLYAHARHTYDRATTAATLTVTGPEGTTTVPIAAPTTTAPYLYSTTAYGLRMGVHVEDPRGGDMSLPIAVDWGNSEPDDLPTWKHTIWPGDRRAPAARWFADRDRGKTFVCTVYAPLSEPVQHVMRLPSKVTARAALPANVVPDTAPEPNAHQLEISEFNVHTRYGTGYVGTFRITNHDREARPWVVRFELGSPAEVHSAWSLAADDVSIASLGDGSWRLWGRTPVPAGTSVDLGVRVEPSGNPTQLPKDVTVQ